MKRYDKNKDIIIKTYDELNSRDKRYVISKLLNNDEFMTKLEESQEEIARDASEADMKYYATILSEKSDLMVYLREIDYTVSKVGVRPKKWDLSELFDCVPFTDSTEDFVYSIVIEGNPYRVSYELSFVEIQEWRTNDNHKEYIRYNLDELEETDVPQEIIRRIYDDMKAAQEFLDNVWESLRAYYNYNEFMTEDYLNTYIVDSDAEFLVNYRTGQIVAMREDTENTIKFE